MWLYCYWIEQRIPDFTGALYKVTEIIVFQTKEERVCDKEKGRFCLRNSSSTTEFVPGA